MLEGFLSMASGWVTKHPADDYWYEPRGVETTSGAEINEDVALTITTVFACVSKIAKTMSTLPIDVIEKTGPRTREPVDHPLEELLDGTANEEASGLTVRETMQANIDAWGKAFAVVDWGGGRNGKEPRAITPLPSKDCELKRDEDGTLYGWYRPDREPIPPDRLWYIPGLSLNGVTALSPVGYNRESLGLAMTATQFGAAFFGNGAWAGGFIKRPKDAPELSPEAAQQWLTSLNEKFRGAKKAFGFALLREDMEFQQIDMPFEDAMFLLTRKFQRVEICGLFDVPLIMIQDDEHSTYRNSEQADIVFAKHSILPRCVRIEKAAQRRFFRGTRLRLKHNLAGLVRGDFGTRMEAYANGRQWGIWSINDCRAMEDLNPIDGGDEYLSPLNMWPVGQPRPVKYNDGGNAVAWDLGDELAGEPVYPAAAAPAIEIDPLTLLRPGIEHAANRIVTRQTKASLDAISKRAKHLEDGSFAEWVERFFGTHDKAIKDELAPTFAALSQIREDAEIDMRVNKLSHSLADSCRIELLLGIGNGINGLRDIVENWRQNLAAQIVRSVERLLTDGESDNADQN